MGFITVNVVHVFRSSSVGVRDLIPAGLFSLAIIDIVVKSLPTPMDNYPLFNGCGIVLVVGIATGSATSPILLLPKRFNDSFHPRDRSRIWLDAYIFRLFDFFLRSSGIYRSAKYYSRFYRSQRPLNPPTAVELIVPFTLVTGAICSGVFVVDLIADLGDRRIQMVVVIEMYYFPNLPLVRHFDTYLAVPLFHFNGEIVLIDNILKRVHIDVFMFPQRPFFYCVEDPSGVWIRGGCIEENIL